MITPIYNPTNEQEFIQEYDNDSAFNYEKEKIPKYNPTNERKENRISDSSDEDSDDRNEDNY